MDIISLTSYQITYLMSILNDERLDIVMESNPWYAQFIPSMRFDIVKKGYVSHKQMYQIEKLARLLDIQWRVIY